MDLMAYKWDTLYKLQDFENLSNKDRHQLTIQPLDFGGYMENLMDLK